MAKSIVIRQLANDEISLETALRRLMIISSDIGNEELYSWSVKELTGYSNDDIIPSYRIIKRENIRCEIVKAEQASFSKKKHLYLLCLMNKLTSF